MKTRRAPPPERPKERVPPSRVLFNQAHADGAFHVPNLPSTASEQ